MSWTLERYPASNGRALDLLQDASGVNARPAFSLTTGDEATTNTLAQADFTPSAATLDLRGNGGRTLRFDYTDPSGLRATKLFTFERDGQAFLVGFSAQVVRNGQAQNFTIHSGPGIGDVDRAQPSGGMMFGSYYQAPEAITYSDENTRTATTALATQRVFDGNLRYAGVDDHYFLGAALLDRPTRVEYAHASVADRRRPPHARVLRSQLPAAAERGEVLHRTEGLRPAATVRPAARTDDQFRMVRLAGVPLLRALKWVNGFVGNYGWSIIVLTILINIAIFPLRHKSVVSMRKMQNIQPRVKAIQERYSHLKATDPARQKMNTEMMELYKTAGVNPASGCVPMLLTMPVLFAFYALLSVAIELRGAPFMLWIQDLSQHDPLYITPVIMGLTMLWQQWITPAAGMDPAQQKVMMIMPLMFTFFFLWAPSGLVVYWLFSNLLTIGQQYLTNRIVGAPPAKPAHA